MLIDRSIQEGKKMLVLIILSSTVYYNLYEFMTLKFSLNLSLIVKIKGNL
jgi:hypothetical protein